MARRAKKKPEITVPSPHDWRTSDADEINKRRLRAQTEHFVISNLDPRHPIFSNFGVKSDSGMKYQVEIRHIGERQFACDCVDFRINGLGTCKHVEAVLLHLQGRFRRLFEAAARNGSTRLDIMPDRTRDTLRLVHGNGSVPGSVKRWFDANGQWRDGSPEEFLERAERLQEAVPGLRISQEVAPWLTARQRAVERKELRRQYELKVQSGEWPAQETRVPLFPYQREGMLHLAFTERALLADEMGLGKTIQAIAACALLQRLGKAQRVLVVTPASLKTEWEEQIRRFTDLPLQLIFGQRHRRLKAYENPPFFTIANYEQMLSDALEVNGRLRPDIVVLDEAQRIKNWSTKTAQAVKRLRSRYAFILTGTPIENRIDEIHSLMDFLDPSVLGPLFRFNRDFYILDDRGRPEGYCNLDQLHARIKPSMLRRRKAEVETELPPRTDRNHFVPLSGEQQASYGDHEKQVSRLINLAKRRPLTKEEQEKLQRELAMMRMICDTNFILDPNDRVCPKLAELEKILEECQENDAKVIVFSEWERMLMLVRNLCEQIDLGFAWHTGTVPQLRRRAEINTFKSDPECRVFLSTDSGSTGLNLQTASVVINCDLPWNPAKLEQRIARAWRKNQTRPVTVINLVSEHTIEHRMLGTLACKQALADGVLDHIGNLKEIKLTSGRQSFLARLQQLMSPARPGPGPESLTPPAKPAPPTDRALAFSQQARATLKDALVRCEERYPKEGAHSVLVVVVDQDPQLWQKRLESLHEELFGPGKTDPLAPTRLEVIDRATDEAVRRLIEAGLIAKTTRATRHLEPEEQAGASTPPLTPQELEQAGAHRAQAARKLKMARLLGQGDLPEETRPALLDAISALGRALAVENRLPEPGSIEDVLVAPLSLCWKAPVPVLRGFVGEAGSAWQPAAQAIQDELQQPGR